MEVPMKVIATLVLSIVTTAAVAAPADNLLFSFGPYVKKQVGAAGRDKAYGSCLLTPEKVVITKVVVGQSRLYKSEKLSLDRKKLGEAIKGASEAKVTKAVH